MSENSNIQGAPEEVEINGKKLRVFPFRDVDHEEYSRWVRKKYLENVRESTDDPAYLREALSSVQKMHWGTQVKVLFTPEGLLKFVQLLTRDPRVPVVVEDFKADDEAGNTLWAAFSLMHPMYSDSENEDSKANSGN